MPADVKKWFRPEILIRMAADVVLLNVALACGILIRVLVLRDAASDLLSLASMFVPGSLFLSIAGPLVFGVMGFYSKGRFYTGRYKIVVILQATALLFLIFGFVNYLILGHSLSRVVVISAWFIATMLIEVARFWAWVWTIVADKDHNTIEVKPVDDRKVLLIGGAGYIGSSLLPRLLERGYSVRLLDGFIYGEEPISSCVGHPALEIVKADFRNVHDVVYAMRGVHAVIHLGAIVGDPACSLDEDLTVEVNLLATRTIAEVAKVNGVRKLIFASTCSVYGASDELLNEKSGLNPVSLYARSKIACERVLLDMADNRFRPVLLRFGTVYGLSGRTRFDLVVNLLSAKAVFDGQITVIGKEQWRPFIHVHDAARSILAALEAHPDQLTDTVFNVGSDEQNYTLGEVGELIKKVVPEADVICTEAKGDARNYRVSFQRIREVLNFRPEWTLEAGIHQVVDAIHQGRVTDYHHSKYSNVKFLSEQNGHGLKTTRTWAKQMLETSPAA